MQVLPAFSYQRFMTLFEGRIAAFAEHSDTYPEARCVATQAIRLWPDTAIVADAFRSCTIDDVLLTSHFVPVDVARQLMFLDQSYTGLPAIFPVRFQVEGEAYRLESEPIVSCGPHVVIGGPIDLVWYHWLFSWCPRFLLTRMLRPELFAAADVRFVVHPHAMRQPFRAVLETFGLDEGRLLVIDPGRDYRLEQATLVSFPDQNKLFPDLISRFADHLLDAFDIDAGVAHLGLFASRQDLPAPKRRIANYATVEPILESFGVRPVSLGLLPAAEQARLFFEASMVVGAHGSDLSNILFCRPGTPVVVIESRFSVDHNLHMGLLKLAEVLELDYRLLVSATTDDVTLGHPLMHIINRDYVVDPQQLEQALREAIASS